MPRTLPWNKPHDEQPTREAAAAASTRPAPDDAGRTQTTAPATLDKCIDSDGDNKEAVDSQSTGTTRNLDYHTDNKGTVDSQSALATRDFDALTEGDVTKWTPPGWRSEERDGRWLVVATESYDPATRYSDANGIATVLVGVRILYTNTLYHYNYSWSYLGPNAREGPIAPGRSWEDRNRNGLQWADWCAGTLGDVARKKAVREKWKKVHGPAFDGKLIW